jgi:hypothetical protein
MTDYKNIVETVLQQYIDAQGNEFAVSQANSSSRLEVDEDGTITSMDGEKKALNDLIALFEAAMGPVAPAMAARAIEDEYDDIEKELPESVEEKI